MLHKTLILALVLSLMPLTVDAQEHKGTLIRQLYRQSGLERQMDQLPLIIQIAFDQAGTDDSQMQSIPRAVVAEMRQAIATAYDPAIIRRMIVDACAEHLSVADVQQVLGWLNTPLGRRITQLEEAASSPESYLAMQRYALEIQEKPPASERLDLIRQLDGAVKATESGVAIALNTQMAVTLAVLAALPVEQQPALADVAAALEQQRSRIENLVRTQTRIALLYTYQAVADTDLAEYIAFASSTSGAKYHAATVSGFKAVLLECGYQWGASIGEILNQADTKTEA